MSQIKHINSLNLYSSTITHPLFILVDGHSLAFRSYYGFSKGKDGGLRTTSGIPTSVCFGFLKCLFDVISSQQPQAITVAFDLGLPTFRHEAEVNYKADRKETPEDFIQDLENLRELLAGLNIQTLTAPGYEADDILGTLAQQAAAAGYQVKILTGDRDLFQLVDVDTNISILYFSPEGFKRSTHGTGISEFFTEQVKAKLGVLPSQVVDYKALCGDKSDNIPGVKGIGEKTAVRLLNTYGSLENIYKSLDKIKGAVKTKLVSGKENANKSRYLATIILDVPIKVDLDSCKLQGFDSTLLIPILEKLEFKSFREQVNYIQHKLGGAVIETSQSSPDNKNDDLRFFPNEDNVANSEQTYAPIQPQIIDTQTKLNDLVEKLLLFNSHDAPVAWDTETSDLEPRDSKLIGIGCCWGTGIYDTAYIPIGHETGDNLPLYKVLKALRHILESSYYPKTFQNVKFDRLVFHAQGIKLNGVVFDPMLASYVLNPDSSHNLSALSLRYLGLTIQSYSDLVPKNKTIGDLSIISVANYCCLQVYSTFQLVGKLREELVKIPTLHKLLLKIEQPLEPVLAEAEYQGIRVDNKYLQELSQQLVIDLGKLEKRVHEIAEEDFNLGSPKQLNLILFEKLGLSTKYSRKNKTGYSTDAATLEKMRDDDKTGIINAIIEYRALAKLKSTYVDALPNLVRSDTQRIHTNFNQTTTSTGRLSSSNPNLQNIPIRTIFSRQIRKAFLPESGWLIVAADYSQIELRILAHLSQEPVLLEAYRNNQDIHTVTAQLMFEKDKVTVEDRRIAKTINFGVIYGMGSLKFSRSIGIDRKLAGEFISKFYARYPRVFKYLEQVKKQAITQGFVETIMGRRRYFSFVSSQLQKFKGSRIDDIDFDDIKKIDAYDSGLLRSAANAPIQGSSADIIKVAMIKMHNVLQDYKARLLLQVHDELVLELPPNEWEELKIRIKLVMENAINLDVPLVVDVHQAENWMKAK